ncbi:DUF397 domain-containing protein [Streptomyces sp. NPDC004042]|uniref:DUF397 domain-containing protein n=1 Tax=Streptomyces sp. NPDC004042 TaxID=3154451 RepID=UPI0033AA3B56
MTTEEPQFFTSSYSSNGGNCIEVAINLASTRGVVPVRDSKEITRPALVVSSGAWSSFVAMAKGAQL